MTMNEGKRILDGDDDVVPLEPFVYFIDACAINHKTKSQITFTMKNCINKTDLAKFHYNEISSMLWCQLNML